MLACYRVISTVSVGIFSVHCLWEDFVLYMRRICLGHFTCFWFFILFYFVCFISAGKAVRVVSGVNLLFLFVFLIRLVKHLLFSSYKKPHSSKNIYDFVFFFFACFVMHLCWVLVVFVLNVFIIRLGFVSWFLNNTLLWLARLLMFYFAVYLVL